MPRISTATGDKDVWKNEGDALASAANYLKKSGYAMGQPWGIEVAVPAGFDFSLADGNERRMDTWRAAGLVPITGGPFETGGADFSQLWLPAGAEGPKYLLFNNFKVFKAYNNADSYAFAVGMSGNAVTGEKVPVTPSGRRTSRPLVRRGDQGSAGQPEFGRGFDAPAWWTAFRAARPSTALHGLPEVARTSWQTVIRPKEMLTLLTWRQQPWRAQSADQLGPQRSDQSGSHIRPRRRFRANQAIERP
jgi:hypothetical protein